MNCDYRAPGVKRHQKMRVSVINDVVNGSLMASRLKGIAAIAGHTVYPWIDPLATKRILWSVLFHAPPRRRSGT